LRGFLVTLNAVSLRFTVYLQLHTAHMQPIYYQYARYNQGVNGK